MSFNSKAIHGRRWPIVALLAVVFAVGTVFAVHDLGLFELDRNALDGAADGDDWDSVAADGGNSAAFTGILEDTMSVNPLGSIGTQFQAGGSKDDLDIAPGGATGQHWKWDPGEPLDKDDITNAYAAAYVSEGTGDTGEDELIIYYGLDRFANNGSAQVGFWFFKSVIGLTTTPSGGGYLFSGIHEIGDILVQSNFSQGGVIDTISVYRWVGSGGSDGTLDLLFQTQDCADLPAESDDPACATVNQGDTPAPWGYTPKFGTAGVFPQGSFFEGGINLTELAPDAGCFSSFLAETRSSTPFDARLKDFALGQFEICDLSVTKDGDTVSKVGDDVEYTIIIENSGAVTLYKQSIVDSLLGDLTDGTNSSITSSDCGASLGAGDSCTIVATRTVLEGDTDPLPNTVTVVYDSSEALDGDEVTREDDHSVNLFQPSITFDKSVDETLSKVGDSVEYTLTLNNTSSDDSPDLVCTITDTAIGVNEEVTLATGESHVITEEFSFEAGDSDPYENTADVSCSPVGFENVFTASDSATVDLFQPSITFDKSVNKTLSKIGDSVDYTLTLTNTSSDDTPDLECTITDEVLGINKAVTLASGDEPDVTNASHTFEEGDSDPFNNTASVVCSPIGFENEVEDSDSASVELFQPSITFDKSGDELSKVGDEVNYTLTLNNTSSGDAPDLECTITDAKLSVNKAVTLSSGASDVTDATYTVQEGDSDPLENTASVTCSPVGFPNVLEESDGHSVNLFQASIDFGKSGPAYSKVGDEIDYVLTLSNTSSTDSPSLECTITDALTGVNKAVTLAPGESDVTNATHLVQAGDPNPLSNTAEVDCSPIGFPNLIEASATHMVTLIHPSFTVAKQCVAEPISADGPANFLVTIANTGDVPLDITADDGIGAFQLAAGASQDFEVSLAGPFTPGSTVDNTVTASWTLPAEFGLPNSDEMSDSDSCDVAEPVFETAYAMGTDATCFISLGAGNWGWVNGNGTTSIAPGVYEWPVWAGAAQCDTNNGTLVGSVIVVYDGTTVNVQFNIDPEFILSDTHVYAGLTQIPSGGFSPGQWEIEGPFNGEDIFVIVHAVVGIPE